MKADGLDWDTLSKDLKYQIEEAYKAELDKKKK